MKNGLHRASLQRSQRIQKGAEQVGEDSLSNEAAGRKRAESALSEARADEPRKANERLAQANRELEAEIGERKRIEKALRDSETELRALFAAMSDIVIVYDRQGRYLKIAPTNTSLLYRPPADMVGKTLYEVLPAREAELLVRNIQRALETGQTVSVDYSLMIGGQEIWFAGALSPLQADTVILVAHNITERKQMEEALRESQERYMLAIQGANDGLWDWDLRSRKVYFSPRWKSMLGYSEEKLGDSQEEWFGRIHPSDLEQVKVALALHLNGQAPHFESEYRIVHRDGSYLWALSRGLAVRDAEGRAYRMAGSQTDITERKRAEEQMLHDAFHDSLTGLPNRALFLDRLGRGLERSNRRKDYLFAVLFMDLDRFKVINDSLGHTIGDQLLVEIANRLRFYLRSSDTAARIGGDEFVVLLEDIKEVQDAIQVSDRIQEELRLPFHLGEHLVYVTASIGLVMNAPGYERPEEILRDADIAMYRAKALGKARCEVFDTNLRDQALARLEMENDLRSSLARGEFRLHYQPIQSLQSGQAIGFEALLRWRPAGRDPIPPAEFIPVAEETGLIIPLGEWVLREACRQLRLWQDQYAVDPPLTMNVNISGKQFTHPGLAEQIEAILAETGVPPSCLRLEITETVFMESAEFADSILSRLSELGINLQIDDFGTGYSSLSNLQRFPIHTIKIDRSFISRIGNNGEKAEIVRTIITLARDLGMDAIAEGIETEEQYAELKTLYCPFGQGYYIAQPLDCEAAGKMLAGLKERQNI